MKSALPDETRSDTPQASTPIKRAGKHSVYAMLWYSTGFVGLALPRMLPLLDGRGCMMPCISPFSDASQGLLTSLHAHRSHASGQSKGYVCL